MRKIIISRHFWTTAVMAAFELYDYPSFENKRESAECLGLIWGNKDYDAFYAHFGTVVQRVKKRTDRSVAPFSMYDQLLHDLWAAQAATSMQILGAFHSHPYFDERRYEFKLQGGTNEMMHTISEKDKDEMAETYIEIIVAVRSLDSEPSKNHAWAERDGVLSGKLDRTFMTIAGWILQPNGKYDPLPIEFPSSADINTTVLNP